MKRRFAYTGCRTSIKRNARGKGIRVYEVDNETGKWNEIQLVSDLINPSFLTFDNNHEFLYSVHGDNKIVSTFKVDKKTGKIAFLESQKTGDDFEHSELDPTRGYNPVHLAVDQSNRFLIVANHEIGKITIHRRNEDGTIRPYHQIVHIPGVITSEGEELSFSRPHQILFDATKKYIIVPAQGRRLGKGIDKVMVFKFNEEDGTIKEVCSIPSRERSWPRHVTIHPNNRFAYVINEVDNTVTSFEFDDESGKLKPMQVIPSLPETYTGNGQASEIEIDHFGKYLYASNRIHDSIVVYSVNQETGMLKALDWVDALGKTPRFTIIDPDNKYYYAASEDEDKIVQFKIEKDGLLSPTGYEIFNESTTCITFLDV